MKVTITPEIVLREYRTSITPKGKPDLADTPVKVRAVDRTSYGSLIIETENDVRDLGRFIDWARKHYPNLQAVRDQDGAPVFYRTIM